MMKLVAPILVFFSISVVSAQTVAGCLSPTGQKFNVPVGRTTAKIANVARTDLNPTRITVRTDFDSLSSLAKQLVLSHECGHAAFRTADENIALPYGGQLMCIMGYSLADLKNAQGELMDLGLTNSQAIKAEIAGYKSKCP